jgi:hypothetical protein
MKQNAALSNNELRQAERYAPLQSRTGRFSLTIKGEPDTHEILLLRNISPFGVGLESTQLVESGKCIRLRYEEADLTLEVMGTVTWNKTKTAMSDQKCYQLGISLCPTEMTKNVHFFRYMVGAV